MHQIDSVYYRNGYGDTPLHIASYRGDCEAITILIETGADIDAIGVSGFTPLHCASQMDNPDAIRLLGRLGAKVIKDVGGESPLELAQSLGNKKATNALREII
ncbi:ankyrin repeat domain-containing protein [Microbulbifer sp. JMSA003]|uniref:ankyrin repeat domain-containing protein n=1 Tax=Microbulbifer sp. JMSA003 TaxID=3243369 RepID=UPI004039841B